MVVVSDASPSRLQSFFAITQSVSIAAGASEDIEISFLPFSMDTYQCALILSDDSAGELLYLINGTVHLPLPEEIPMSDNTPGKMPYLPDISSRKFYDFYLSGPFVAVTAG